MIYRLELPACWIRVTGCKIILQQSPFKKFWDTPNDMPSNHIWEIGSQQNYVCFWSSYPRLPDFIIQILHANYQLNVMMLMMTYFDSGTFNPSHGATWSGWWSWLWQPWLLLHFQDSFHMPWTLWGNAASSGRVCGPDCFVIDDLWRLCSRPAFQRT